MSSTNSILNYNNLERIKPLSLEEFNKLLIDNKPYSFNTFNSINPNTIKTLEEVYINYNIDLKLLICSKCFTTLSPTLELILRHFKVRYLL